MGWLRSGQPAGGSQCCRFRLSRTRRSRHQSAPLCWSPLADLQDVTLRMIAERLLPKFVHAYT
eukprot:3681705-Prymnesium_polylepis.1